MELKSVGCRLHGYISFFFSVKFKNFCNVLYFAKYKIITIKINTLKILRGILVLAFELHNPYLQASIKRGFLLHSLNMTVYI